MSPAGSVRSRLTGIALLLLLPAWLLAGFSAWRLAEAERAAAARAGQDIARRVTAAIDRDVAALRAAMVALSTSPALHDGDLAAFHAQAHSLARTEGLNVELFDATGRARQTTQDVAPESLEPLEVKSLFRQAANTGRLAVSDLFAGPGTGRPLIGMVLPVEEDPEQPLRYFLGFSTDAESYWSRMLQELDLPPGWTASILDSRQRIVARHPDPAQFIGQPAHPETLSAIAAAGRPEGLEPGSSQDGKPVYVAWATPREVPWRVLVDLPRGELDRLIEHSVLPILGAGALTLLAATLAGGWWAAHHLMRPLAALERAAAALGAGHMPDAGPRSGLREIDSIAAALREAAQERDAREEALQESERRFRTLADTVPQLVWSTRSDGVTDYVNRRLVEYTGVSPENAGSETLTELIHPEDRGQVLEAWAQATKSGEPYHAEFRMRRADGSHGWVVSQAVPVHGSDGTPIRWVGASTDVNELVEARRALERQVVAEAAARQAALAAAEALAASEDRFRRFAEASPDAIWISDPEGRRLEYLGPAFADIWGEPLDAALADPGLRLSRVLEEDRPRLEQAMAEVQQGGVRDVQYRIRRSDTEVRWIRDSIFAVRDGSGRVTRIGGLARDITERREAEDRQALLLAELNHRVKNTLATVQSLALQTARAMGDAAQPMPRFLADFQGRLMALARGHDLLTARSWRGAPLAEVASAALAPWLPTARAEPPRILLSGPGAWLAPRQAVALSLALHELATNAAKHGALSVAAGRAVLEWKLEPDGMLALDWTERYGPPAREPERTGFGTRLLKQGLPADLGAGARVDMWYRQEGFAAAIRFRPIDKGDESI